MYKTVPSSCYFRFSPNMGRSENQIIEFWAEIASNYLNYVWFSDLPCFYLQIPRLAQAFAKNGLFRWLFKLQFFLGWKSEQWVFNF